MTAVAVSELDLRQIEQFLYREARYADEHDYDAWEALWTDDALYWVPAGADAVDPTSQMSVIYDNRSRISTRLKQLRTGKRHSQSPPSSLRRVISNVEVLSGEVLSGEVLSGEVLSGEVPDGQVPGGEVPGVEMRGGGGAETIVGANFMLAESRARGTEIWAGRTTYRLRVVDGEIRLAYKKVLLVNCDQPLPTLAFLI